MLEAKPIGVQNKSEDPENNTAEEIYSLSDYEEDGTLSGDRESTASKSTTSQLSSESVEPLTVVNRTHQGELPKVLDNRRSSNDNASDSGSDTSTLPDGNWITDELVTHVEEAAQKKRQSRRLGWHGRRSNTTCIVM